MTRVWVTRDEPADGPLSTALRAAQLETVSEPVVERRVVANLSPLLATLGPGDWLVLGSAFAISAIPAGLVRCRVAVVGEASRALAEARGLRVSLVSPDQTGRGLWRALRDLVAPGGTICYPRSSLAPPPQPWAGVELIAPVLYETVERAVVAERLTGVRVAVIASPSAAGPAVSIAPTLSFASIGPTTTEALRRLGVEPWVQATSPSFDSLARAIAARIKDAPEAPHATSGRTPTPHT